MKYYGDFLGFQFGSYHSRDLGLYRVSDGDRYNDVSIPNFTDTTQKIPGGDGTYYWDSFYTQRTFTINTAFDDLSESQLRNIRQIFNGKAEDWLIFDEVPYKKYRVKVQNPPQIKYHTFREDYKDGEYLRPRVYKGEITFQFISYTPYAIDNFKVVPFNRVEESVASDSVVSGALTSSISLRTPWGDTRTISSGTVLYIPADRLPVGDETICVTYDCPVYTFSTDPNQSQQLVKYRFGATPQKAVSVERYNNSYRVGFRDWIYNDTGYFISSLSSTVSSINYLNYKNDWQLVSIDQQTYNKNPRHYYTKYSSIKVPGNIGAYSSTASYYVPNLRTDGKITASYPNAIEWQDSVQLLGTDEDAKVRHLEVLESTSSDGGGQNGYFIYNPGDLPTDVKIIIDGKAIAATESGIQIKLKRRSQGQTFDNDKTIAELNFEPFSLPSNSVTEKQIVIDSAQHLVYSTNYSGAKSGNLYNKYITSGDFFKLPVTQEVNTSIAAQSSFGYKDFCDYVLVNFPKMRGGGANVYLDYNYLYY